MFRRASSRWLAAAPALVLCVAALLLPACVDGRWAWQKKELPPEGPARPLPENDPILAETIGARTLLGGIQPTRLRGFGLVVNLGDGGGADCPTSIRDYLIEYFSKQFLPDSGQRGLTRVSPRQLIDSLDTAVVEVQALIPAGAPAGTRVDVQIEAIGSQTTSLEGGLLLPCELKVYDVAASGQGLIAGRALARARGVVFTNPFASGANHDPTASKRRGYVLGGGESIEDRYVRLLLEEPSYSVSRRIENRVNERFGQHPPTAEAISRGYLQLVTPAQFADDPGHFVDLVTHLHIDNVPGQIERRLRVIDRNLHTAGRRLADVSLIWEGIGRKAIPSIRMHYEDDDRDVRYYSARAGLRLDDTSAIAVMGDIAGTAEHPQQLFAIRELGQSDNSRVVPHLTKLLDSDDQQVRIAAYRALLRHRHAGIETQRFAAAADPTQTNFTLDVVPSNGRPMVYIRRTEEPRMAVFGRAVPVSLPMFYEHPDAWVTLNALDQSGEITLFCRTRQSGQFSEPLHVPARVVDLIRALGDLPLPNDGGVIRGIGLPFSTLVRVFDTLQRDGTIPALLVMETTSIPDLLGPTERPQRRESDERAVPLEQSDDVGAAPDGESLAQREPAQTEPE